MKTKMLLFTAIASIAFITGAQAQIVNIPDANFKAALVGNASINTNMDAEIQVSEAAAYTGAIHVSQLGITDLTGIEAFVLLDSLDCSNNQIAGLDVSANIGLKYLDCSGALVFFPSNLSSINVTGLNNLTYLDCGANILMSLDVSTNTSLNYLDCSSACVNGGIGGGYYGALTNLNLSGAIALTYLDCSFDGTAMPMSFAQSSFGYLDVSTNTALTYINCSGNVLTSLDVSSCTALNSLDCYGNQLANLNISPNSALTYINCSGNALTSLDVSACTALTTLNCSYNQLSSLDVSANTALTTLDCYYNQLTSLDVSANTALSVLSCDNNQLTSVDVSANTALTVLGCSYNQLTSLDVSANTALTVLGCSYNQLTSLDVSANTALTGLYCSYNQLTSLDVSANTALTGLYCSDNQLTSLNVNNGNNINMFNFFALGNPNLSCIEVDSAAWSNINWPYIDTTASFSENCSGAGISDINESNAPMFYPNPTTGTIYLSEQLNITLIDLSGKLLLEEKNTTQLDLSALPAGMYFLRVGENNNQLVKVIKE
jgi:Leucine-rich repeat (LRR) protein